jgi:large subunit ribosomal protein L2
MALKTFRPLTPVQRTKQTPAYSEITKDTPEKSLVEVLKRTGGRNNRGRLTSRHIGGGHKQKYRVIDFKRRKRDVAAQVIAIEYDPNRSARIALVQYTDGEKAYILAPAGLLVGAKVIAGENVPPDLGNALPLRSIPLGTAIHNVEITAGRGGQVARSAGQLVILNNREAGYALVKMPSGEIRKIQESCYATIGQVGNVDHMNVKSGKAGRTRWQGRRPHVRGMVMNPIDHPMGGGQGKSKGGGGRHHPVSPWGQLAKGFKTRRKHKTSDVFIIERRKSKKKTK